MRNERSMSAAAPAPRRRCRTQWLCVLAGAGIVAITAGAGLLSSRAQSPTSETAVSGSAVATAKGGVGAKTQDAPQPNKQETADTAMRTQQQEVADEAAHLLKMATDLKAAVDKTTKDQLSVGVVRKAGEIEQLAHKVRAGTGKG